MKGNYYNINMKFYENVSHSLTHGKHSFRRALCNEKKTKTKQNKKKIKKKTTFDMDSAGVRVISNSKSRDLTSVTAVSSKHRLLSFCYIRNNNTKVRAVYTPRRSPMLMRWHNNKSCCFSKIYKTMYVIMF